MTDWCVCCGAVVPEGRMVCRQCELREETQMDETMIALQLERVDQRCKSNTHRLDEMEKRQDNLDKLVTSVEVLATKQQAMETDVKEIKIDVKALTDKPGKRWEQLVSTVLSIIVGAVLGVLLAKVGLG